ELPASAIEATPLGRPEPIAIIGMGCRFPGGVHTPESFWDLPIQGVDTVTEIPNSRWNLEAYYDPNPNKPGKMYVRAGSFLEGVDQFDPQFFGITPREAASLDPQQRLLLEVSWEALEHAGVAPAQLRESLTGVFVGSFWDDYSALHLYADDPSQIDAYRTLSNLRGLAAGRIAYVLGSQGPTMQLDTTCSSSLLAVHMACQSLRNKECHLALAGGVALNLSPELAIGLCSMNALAFDGRCKTFDAKADGFGLGEGCGMVILKRFSDAIRDGDNIMALIRGSAVNHDGRSNGLTAPNGLAQEALLRQALEKAAVKAEQIQYVETHGTGTSLGDPIEVLALANVLGQERTTPLTIGSVKTNLGHLSSAAGIASLMKVVLSLQHAQIPPNLHFTEPNPHIPWDKLPLTVPTETTPWTGEPKLAGVSSFGMSGTNVHLIVEEAPKTQVVPIAEPEYQLFVLSAKNEERLLAYAKKIIDFLESAPPIPLVNLTYTLQVGRNAMEERLAMRVSRFEEIRNKLTQYVQGQAQIENFYRGNVKRNKAQTELFIKGEAGEAFLKVLLEKKELNQLAQLWVSGVEIDWQLLYPNQKPQRISLPTYPFARERYWIPVSEPKFKEVSRDQVATISSKTPVTTQFYQSVWEPDVLEKQMGTHTPTRVLLFDTDSSRYFRFKERFSTQVILVTPGERYLQLAPDTYSINPKHPADYQKLLSTLPSHIIHLWSQAPFVSTALNTQLDMSLFSIFHLSQAILLQKPSELIKLLYVYLESDEALQPQYAALSGFAKTIPLVNSKLNYKTVALPSLDKVVDMVLAEFKTVDGVAIRYYNNQRWVKRLQKIEGAHFAKTTPPLKENGVYLITGGAGGLGLIFAKYLAKNFKARLVLTGRSPLGKKDENLRELRHRSASVLYLQADVADESAMT
ncbi:MAG: type I polyketide synthase, partial [Candidatus Parabeggiatoa sp.]|nr:type I polyketide synthase [Candidatus Parabeggiatoa sp.]